MLLITVCINYFFEDATASVKMNNKSILTKKWISNEIVNDINTMLCPIKVNSNTFKLTVQTSCYCVLDLLCVTCFINSKWKVNSLRWTGQARPLSRCQLGILEVGGVQWSHHDLPDHSGCRSFQAPLSPCSLSFKDCSGIGENEKTSNDIIAGERLFRLHLL